MTMPCQCCSSPLGVFVRVEGTERIICERCLGFIARWWIEMGEVEKKQKKDREEKP